MATTGKIGVTTENIFPVIKKFLYSDHEIFLRELVANAVDATQKMKALASSGDFKGELGEVAVRIELDEKKKTLKIIDNGIGMTSTRLHFQAQESSLRSTRTSSATSSDTSDSDSIPHSWWRRRSLSRRFHGRMAQRP